MPPAQLKSPVAQYITVTLSYWAFTLTDGALRMLVVLFFHNLSYSPLEIATLFLLYEFFGIVTNLFGGWLAARVGLNVTMHVGLALQIIALGMLLVDPSLLTVVYVMIAQALSGIAKDLNKMSAKSSIKMLVPNEAQSRLYHWVAVLTGSKNTLKGIGFFLGGLLLATIGFQGAIAAMAGTLSIVLIVSCLLLDKAAGKTTYKPKFRELLSKNPAINRLSAARFFLFGSRDIWFVVALPVFLQAQLGWDHTAVGSMLATWVIGYGIIQSIAPRITDVFTPFNVDSRAPTGKTALTWAMLLCLVPALIATALHFEWNITSSLVIGLLIFGALFAINSSVHSYLIVAYAKEDGVSLDVGFYYMANAAGRLVGTVLSGWIYQQHGLEACLFLSSAMIATTSLISWRLPRHHLLQQA